MLPRAHRLRRSADFSDVVRRGTRAGASTLVVYQGRSFDGSSPRVGFVVGRNVGPAVVRNRVKRRLRHLMADRLPASSAVSLVVRANPPAALAGYADLAHDLDSCLTRLNRRRISAGAR